LLLDENASLSEFSVVELLVRGLMMGSSSGMVKSLPGCPHAINRDAGAMPNVVAIVALATEESFVPPTTFFFSIFK